MSEALAATLESWVGRLHRRHAAARLLRTQPRNATAMTCFFSCAGSESSRAELPGELTTAALEQYPMNLMLRSSFRRRMQPSPQR